MMTLDRPRRLPLAVALTTAVVASLVALSGPSSANHQTVTAVQGSAYGCFGNTQFALGGPPGPPRVTGPLPTVTLPQGGSATPITATAAACDILAFEGGPAVVSTGQLNVSTQGTTGPTGSVTSTASIANVNRSGQEAFTAANVSSTCTANEAGATGSTTITGGRVETSENVFQDVPVNPPPGFSIDADIGVATTRYIFNEQITDPTTGAITVNAVRIQPLTGPLTGTVILGQVVCDVTTQALATTTTPTTTTPTTTTPTTTTPTTTSTSTTVTLPTTTTSTTSTTMPQTTITTATLPTTTTTVVNVPTLIQQIVCPILLQLRAIPFLAPFIDPLLVSFGCVVPGA